MAESRLTEHTRSTAPLARSPARADTVGSLLRPAQLRQAMAEVYEDRHTALLPEERRKDLSRLHRIEDDLIAEAIRRQIDIGLDVVTDGELRRYMFTNSFYDAVDGLEPSTETITFVDAGGDRIEYPGPPMIRERLRTVDSPAAREAAYLASITDYPFKITFPAASWFCFPFWWRPGITDRAYGDAEEMIEHAIAIERELIAEAIAAGAPSIQLDFPVYPYLLDERWLRRLRAGGVDPEALLDRALAADRAVVEGIPDRVTVALHLCRGNFRSHWLASGSIEPIAERLFNELPYHRFLIEWEDVDREGGYEPLRHVPRGPIVVMGIVSSKRPELEPEDDLMRRMDEAANYLDLDQLAISPQCGFASVLEGNEVSEEVQWQKLELVARVADRIWGRA